MRNSHVLVYGLLCVGLAVGSGCNSRTATRRINGGGATFVEPLINAWQSVYAKETGVQIDYTGTGSGNGVQQMTKQAIRFGCTDAPMTEEQIKAAHEANGEVIHIPLAMGGVVAIYNVPGVAADKHLKFTGQVLADVFLGDITKWNDPALKELNPDVNLPDLAIKVVSRSDPSGTTAIFSEYLQKSRPEKWTEKKMGKGTSVTYSVGTRAPKNPGVAGEVSRTEGAIGYVELTYAKLMKEKAGYGSVKNRAGKFVLASPESVTAAAAGLTDVPDSLTFSLVDAPGDDSYPISGADWAVFYKKQPAATGKPLVEFLRWATAKDKGQKYGPDLGYAPLPDKLIERIDAKLKQVEFQ